jgi:hypothetical protein
MIQFTLRYKMPEDLDDEQQEGRYKERMFHLARKIQVKAEKIFNNRDVAFEVRPFGDNDGQPDICVTGLVVNNSTIIYLENVLKAQAEILALMEQEIYEDQTLECSWTTNKGKSSGGTGKKLRPPSH